MVAAFREGSIRRGPLQTTNRALYSLYKPRGPVKEKEEMPFAASRRDQFWTADVRYVDDHRLGGRAYVVSILENHSHAILASVVTRTQDLASYLPVLYAAVERYGSPEALVTDGGGIFRARQAKAVYAALRIRKEEIEHGRAAEAVRDVGDHGAAAPLRARRPRRARLAKGAQAARVRSPPAPRTARPAAGALPGSASGSPLAATP